MSEIRDGDERGFPTSAGILFGLGLGGFFDGIMWLYWDLGFLAWGAVMLFGGWLLWRSGKQETARTPATCFSSSRFS